MSKIARALEGRGYQVINLNYPSRSYNIETLANKYIADCITTFCTDKKKKIHFVTHSLGGIVLRKYLAHHILASLGRVVMVAPPNQGSALADYFNNHFLYKFLYRFICGPTGQELGASQSSYFKSLPQKSGLELGVIAGNKGINPFAYLIKGPNDGIIPVSSTKIKGMKDHIVLPYSHLFILYRAETVRQVIHFIEAGEFTRHGSS